MWTLAQSFWCISISFPAVVNKISCVTSSGWMWSACFISDTSRRRDCSLCVWIFRCCLHKHPCVWWTQTSSPGDASSSEGQDGFNADYSLQFAPCVFLWLSVPVRSFLCATPSRLSYLSAPAASQRTQSLPAAHSLQIISSCVITGSLAEFRACLSAGLQLFLSLGCNIDVPFGWFYPKLLTETSHAFLGLDVCSQSDLSPIQCKRRSAT